MTFYLSVLLAIYFILLMALGFTVFKLDRTFRDMNKEIKSLKGTIEVFEEEQSYQRKRINEIIGKNRLLRDEIEKEERELNRIINGIKREYTELSLKLEEHTRSEKSVLDAVDGYTAKISARIDELNSVKPRKDMPIGLLIRGDDDPSGRPQYFVLKPYHRVRFDADDLDLGDTISEMGMDLEPYLGEGIGGVEEIMPAPPSFLPEKVENLTKN